MKFGNYLNRWGQSLKKQSESEIFLCMKKNGSYGRFLRHHHRRRRYHVHTKFIDSPEMQLHWMITWHYGPW